MAESNLHKFSDHDRQQLQHLSNLLQLFNHRNKNQHRRSVWCRHFSVFRRQLDRLLEGLESLNEEPKTHFQRTQKRAKDETTRSRISQRLKLWQDVLVPKWQNTFSQIVPDGRFAVLGIVLLAVLAQTCQISGITADLEDLGQREVEKILYDFAEEYWVTEDEPPNKPDLEAEDVGEVVAREQDQSATKTVPKPSQEDGTPRPISLGSANQPKRKRISHKHDARSSKTKRRKENAIDDLFGGLD